MGCGSVRFLPVVPDDFRFRAGKPLEHAGLVPAPGACLAQVDPAVAVLGIDHADAQRVGGGGQAVLEAAFDTKGVAAGRIELQLIVVAEPVELRSLGDGADGRQLFIGGSGGKGGEELTAVHVTSGNRGCA